MTAKLLGIESQVGSINIGKTADIIAINGNPLKDISKMQDIGFVMKDGVVIQID
jgi:imidazolonepropionase-like amidohydrolase